MEQTKNPIEAVLETVKATPPEEIAEAVSKTYPHITLQDAIRVRDGLTAILTAGTKEEAHRLGKEYEALHATLRQKYRKSGGH